MVRRQPLRSVRKHGKNTYIHKKSLRDRKWLSDTFLQQSQYFYADNCQFFLNKVNSVIRYKWELSIIISYFKSKKMIGSQNIELENRMVKLYDLNSNISIDFG